ncbi:membrane protein insertase YidC [Kutzneria kofuensis]|uniref:Membrane protein insertase YidC n=1 Tax=Kutzneria kofuensis TaxID=103725 RepID=A0A7W9KHF9_9PSEU|nr:membrane protein insertase YidC [Kutzneria kofuensis]MBB5892649.1 YidC/Oxa1 family membrane protein insertase [Kutzneria kofuensis]
MLNFIYYPVSGILWVWHKVFGAIFGDGAFGGAASWALSVVFLVFTLRVILFKPFVAQVKSMRKMAEFQPEIKKLQKKYANDKQKLAAEMQKLQSEHGVNPLAGCLPILLQAPVFIGLNHVLRSFNRPGLSYDQNIKIANYWIPTEDVQSFLQARLFGAPLSSYIAMADNELNAFVPHVGRLDVILVSIPLMIVASIATHLTARHNVARQTAAVTANPQTAMMNKLTLYLFPLGVLAFGAFLQIGLLFYWLSNNAWTLGQQYFVYHRIDREEAEAKAKKVEQRNNLAPKPGQKPMQQVRKVGKSAEPADTTDAAETASAESESTGNGSSAPANGSAVNGSGDASTKIPGLAPDRARKKQSRKRR